MSRRRARGRDVSGWLVLDKPAGMSSAAAVALIKRAYEARKVGHAGTLDPDATGILAVALGEATKTVPFHQDGLKTYRFEVAFGAATDTDDATGRIIETRDARPSDEEIAHALASFVGTIEQRPPRVSAVKVDGQRAYALARQGADFDLAPRLLEVRDLRLCGRRDRDHAELELVCGKGGYVRSIARDLGELLGCLGHVAWLRRTASGSFTEHDAVTPEQIENAAGQAERDHLLRPVEAALSGIPELPCTATQADALRQGRPLAGICRGIDEGTTAWASHGGRVVAIGECSAAAFHPRRVFAP